MTRALITTITIKRYVQENEKLAEMAKRMVGRTSNDPERWEQWEQKKNKINISEKRIWSFSKMEK